MYLTAFLFILGFVFLIKGAGILIDGSSSIARRFGVSAFFIGLTVVAFGTSAPELVVSALAGIRGNSGLALGNLIGSNMANTLLILGTAAIVRPLIVKRNTINKEIPFSLLAVLAVGILANNFLIDGVSSEGLARTDGLILILFFVIFLFYTFGIAREKENIFKKTVGDLKLEPREYNIFLAVGMIIAGLAGLAIGGEWIVDGAVELAKFFGLSEALIGLTIVAVGTSLPEFAASVVAAKRGQTDIAVGNVVGSNIFNFLWVLGLSATISPISFNPILNFDILFLMIVSILLLVLIYIGRRNILARQEGMVLVGLYVLYVVFLILRG
ncbi:sodium:proton exchanger [Candidatus Falkowbacteria bacterium CG11_big_fil_rev_8_21_14_0_20_39_10]|uniref:Sodium:proton exchanger n=1 Tax=Candidatus Falkowbacteria bacterium CG11_big_fil_rev_8_21_14_0_20_39_10 TaxID=1974570 RepID=A0A2M6K9D9_9BACT|nr:MAG: sodium:proton exchanger [Candidatus Falkowbacteria bacterium CG11_big_fil_rev_8_21_14_0_20_39_10]